MNLEVLKPPIALDLLDPKLVLVNGEFLHVDQVTKKIVPNTIMEEYNRYFGYSGYDEINDLEEGGTEGNE